ncbi:MAG: DUF1846 domain-containing protein [Patescibacteria group bacterium]
MKKGFDSKLYLKYQTAKIREIIRSSTKKLYIEFGGKIVHDKHAARVLPGYDENVKLSLIKKICRDGEVIFVVSAKDIIGKRIRGDFKITYDQEALRVIAELRKNGLKIKNVALTMLPRKKILPKCIKKFDRQLKKIGITPYHFYEIKDYNYLPVISDFDINPYIKTRKKIVVILSPGGGSGKFDVCLSQLYHEMKNGVMPSYLKFETFPVHDLPLDHPINLAYMVATADLYNETFPVHDLPLDHPINLAYMAASADFYDLVMHDPRHHKVATSYKRDVENYELLRKIAYFFPKEGKHLIDLSSATSMGVNMLSRGIIDDELVQKEAAAEIARRLIRYKFEVKSGKEDKEILKRVRNILARL